MPNPWPRNLPPQNSLQESIHERHWDTRQLIIAALNDSYYTRQKKHARRLAQCADGAALYVHPTQGHVSPWLSRCGSRLCPFCARKRSAAAASQIFSAITIMRQPRMIVLTVKSTEAPLAEQLVALRHAFARLRRYKLWHDRVTGGIYTIEITRNAQTGLFHPHVHIIYDGQYIPQSGLRKAWHKATGGAEIVWISKLRERQNAANELAKYIGKPQGVKDWPNQAIREHEAATRNQRLLHTFGSLHGRHVKDTDRPAQLDPAQYSVRLSRIVYLARLGADAPQRITLLIADRFKMFAPYIYHALPQLSPEPPPHRPSDTHDVNLELLTLFRRFRFEDDKGDYDALAFNNEFPGFTATKAAQGA